MKKITIKLDKYQVQEFSQMLYECLSVRAGVPDSEYRVVCQFIIYEFIQKHLHKLSVFGDNSVKFGLLGSEAVAIYRLFLSVDFTTGSLALCREVLRQIDLPTQKLIKGQ